eukprot:CAMPEP_0116983434 /NCGR_PEP_ID=MMETSP0467-20121206/60967_1 /TAXON_ID=283647 /ORGANISM="Mesodinium pulex, Strain SPMC105" /LENGTH=129 /DNA_ID=CAMNT_0004678179 /DNA_START=264 /DNA_END=653 /DNA_ORIENTATION=+
MISHEQVKPQEFGINIKEIKSLGSFIEGKNIIHISLCNDSTTIFIFKSLELIGKAPLVKAPLPKSLAKLSFDIVANKQKKIVREGFISFTGENQTEIHNNNKRISKNGFMSFVCNCSATDKEADILMLN